LGLDAEKLQSDLKNYLEKIKKHSDSGNSFSDNFKKTMIGSAKIAIERGLDLIVVSPNAEPPVAKILDFKKFLYQERKEKTKAKIRSKKTDTKEIMFKPFTAEGDLNWQMARAKEWLTEGNRVKVWVAMKGRSASHPEISREKIQKFITELETVAKAEGSPEQKGNVISVLFIPR